MRKSLNNNNVYTQIHNRSVIYEHVHTNYALKKYYYYVYTKNIYLLFYFIVQFLFQYRNFSVFFFIPYGIFKSSEFSKWVNTHLWELIMKYVPFDLLKITIISVFDVILRKR